MKLFKKRVNEAPVVDSGDMATDIEAVMRKYDRESATRIWEGWQKTVVQVLMAVFSLYRLPFIFSQILQQNCRIIRLISNPSSKIQRNILPADTVCSRL